MPHSAQRLRRLASMDLQTRDDCRALVEAFYEAARKDPLLGPVFESRIAGHWDAHLERMARFWATVLFATPLYFGRPVESHLGLPIAPVHFERWLRLWTAEIDRRWSGPHAEMAKRAAHRMSMRLSVHRSEGSGAHSG